MNETKADLQKEIETRGAWAAYRASLAVCEDPKAPPSARSQAASNILRAAGLFATRQDDAGSKQPHEMTADELRAEVERLTRGHVAEPGVDVFD